MDTDTHGPYLWNRPPTVDEEASPTTLAIEVPVEDSPDRGGEVKWRVGEHEGWGELAGPPDERPVVVLLGRSVPLNGEVVEALRLPSGTADAVAQSVQFARENTE